jgi:transposase-like protein
MPYLLQIEFPVSLEESSLVGRILNFKDEVYGKFHDHAGAEIVNPEAVDMALAPLTIRIRSKRFLTAATEFVRKASEREGLSDTIVVTCI